jgi:hypothetical protein
MKLFAIGGCNTLGDLDGCSRIIGNSNVSAGQFVEENALTDIRIAHNGN